MKKHNCIYKSVLFDLIKKHFIITENNDLLWAYKEDIGLEDVDPGLCNKVVKLISDEYLNNAEYFAIPSHGDRTTCPTCGAPGRIDLVYNDGRLSFNDSIWWNKFENGWECWKCWDK